MRLTLKQSDRLPPISSESIRHLTKTVSEQIPAKDLYDFFHTTLHFCAIPIAKNTKITWEYFPSYLRYELYIVTTDRNEGVLEHSLPLLLYNRKEIIPSIGDLFITPTFFAFYSNSKLQIAMKNDSFSNEDIEKFIAQHTTLFVEKTYIIDNSLLLDHYNTAPKKQLPPPTRLLSLQKSKSGTYYILYLLTLFAFAFGALYNQISSNDLSAREMLHTLTQQHALSQTLTKKEPPKIPKLEKLLLSAKNFELSIQALDYAQKVSLTLHGNDQNMYSFLELNDKKLKILTLQEKGNNQIIAQVECRFE